MMKAIDGIKECSKCKGVKCISEFSKDSSRTDDLQNWCKACDRAANQLRRQEIIYVLHLLPVLVVEVSRSRANGWKSKSNHGYQLGNGAKYDAGLISACEHFELLWNNQKGLCAVCGTHLHGRCQSSCNVDHDHGTGEVRGLLCGSCNALEGHMNKVCTSMGLSELQYTQRLTDYLQKT